MKNKITRDNYIEALDSIKDRVDKLPNSEIESINSVFKNLKIHIVEIKKNAQDLMRDNNILRIGVVGQVKAGKSSFLNSLLFDGESILPKAATPMTAGLTVLEYGEANEFIVEYYTTDEWSLFEDRAKDYDEIIQFNRQASPEKSISEIETEIGISDELKSAKELVKSCKPSVRSKIDKNGKTERVAFRDYVDMRRQLEDYVGAEGKFTPIVKTLTIKLKDKNLELMQIVDTPGVNDPIISREERTRQFLSTCHGVLFLSYSGRFFDSTDVDFLVRRIGGQGIGTVVVIASKYDSVLQDVGNKFHDDLDGADDYCSSGLKKQMNRNISESDYDGNMPRMTVSSGIGYSIAKKSESTWDATERHVVERMKVYYPENFSDDASLRETFMLLSQIKEIKEDFVENEFLKRKDEIIESKLTRFFTSISEQLHSEIKEGCLKVENWIKQLEESEIDSLERRKRDINKSIDTLNNKLNGYSHKFDAEVKNFQRELANVSAEMSSPRIVTHMTQGSFQRKSTFWGRTKSFSQNYREVDKISTKDKGIEILNTVLSKVSNFWADGVSRVRKNLFDEIDNIIMNLETNDKEGCLDADILRDLVRDAFDHMGGVRTFVISSIKKNAEESIKEKCNSTGTVPYKFGEMEEREAQEEVRMEADRVINNLERRLSQWVDETVQNINSQINKDISELRSVLTSRRDEMIKITREKTDNLLSGLKTQLENKQKNLAVYKDAYSKLNSILQLV